MSHVVSTPLRPSSWEYPERFSSCTEDSFRVLHNMLTLSTWWKKRIVARLHDRLRGTAHNQTFSTTSRSRGPSSKHDESSNDVVYCGEGRIRYESYIYSTVLCLGLSLFFAENTHRATSGNFLPRSKLHLTEILYTDTTR